jgi:molybdate transport system ATP-binding protein
MKLEVRVSKLLPKSYDSAGFSLDIEFSADPGITVLFGPSGAGKTLTLDLIAGFARPDSGRILLDDVLLFDAAAKVHLKPQDRDCGYVSQRDSLFPHMTIRQNLAFAAERRPRLERHRRVQEMIDRFHLAGVAGRLPSAVSGGQRQRCSIARALITAPQALLLDEPATGLDAPLRAELFQILLELRKELDIPLLYVTHDLDEAVLLGDRMLIYDAGRIVQGGAPQAVLSRPASAKVAQMLGHTNICEAEILALDPSRDTSRLRVSIGGGPAGELRGPYLPGQLIGDRVRIVTRADELRVFGVPGENRLPAVLESAVDLARMTELRFAGGLVVLASRGNRDFREWFIEFPPEGLRVLGGS